MMNKNNLIYLSKSAILFLLMAIILWFKCKWFALWCLSFLDANYDYSQLAQNLAISAAALVVASLVWISKRPWLCILLMTIIDLWIIANIIYFRANHLLITYSAIAMCSNMDGFEQAILAYFDWRIYLIPAITVIYAVIAVWLSPARRYPLAWGGTLLAAVICSLIASPIRCEHRGVHNPWLVNEPIDWQQKFNPFSTPTNLQPENWKRELVEINYTYHHSIIAYACNIMIEGRKQYHELVNKQSSIHFTSEEKDLLNTLISPSSTSSNSAEQCDGNLIIVVIESWEGWVFDYKDKNGQYVMPHIQQFMQEHPYLLAPNMMTLVRYGTSGDGQMIINTGLLPLYDGAACMLYGDNVYPNLAHFYAHSANIDACSRAWNGNVTSKSYSYQQHIAPDNENWWFENTTLSIAKEQLKRHRDSTCIQVITIATHSPFEWVKDEAEYGHHLEFTDDVNDITANYLRSIYWMDNFIGDFLSFLEREGLFDTSTIVLTGDHTFNRADEYYCPFLAFSPSVQTTKLISDIVYQVDAYPTILSLIGQKDYYWPGLGIDLSSNSLERKISIAEAYAISDKLIRMNYFNTYKK